MKIFTLHIKILLLLAFMACSNIAFMQGKNLTIEKGARTFTADTKADSVAWYINGVLQNGIDHNKFTNNWAIGEFALSAIPFNEGCPGDEFIVNLTVKEDVTVGDTQVVITTLSPLLACPASNVFLTDSAIVEVEFRAYNNPLDSSSFVLVENQDYAVTYKIDENGEKKVTLLDTAKAWFTVDVKNLNPGNHELKILKLSYGAGFKNQVDYTHAKHQPTLTLKVKPKPMIKEIEIVEDSNSGN